MLTKIPQDPPHVRSILDHELHETSAIADVQSNVHQQHAVLVGFFFKRAASSWTTRGLTRSSCKPGPHPLDHLKCLVASRLGHGSHNIGWDCMLSQHVKR